VIDAPAPKPVILNGEGLTKSYQMGDVRVQALREVDFSLREGELVVLLGPSGSGKSTLLNILGGLDTPTSGKVTYRDEDLSHADEAELTRYRRCPRTLRPCVTTVTSEAPCC